MNNPQLTSYWFNANHFKLGEEHQFNITWLLILSFSIIFIGLGLRDPWPADEPRFAQIAREMVESGQWFFPTRGGELYPDKPPVFMWSIAAFYYLTGSIKLSFLLPSAICSVVTTMLVYDLGRRLWSEQVGWYASLLLLSTVQFVLQAKSAQIDAMVCCWITIGCYGLARHLLLDGHWKWYFLACFFMGLGIITKGVGFLPILMLIPYAIARFIAPQDNEIKGGFRWLIGPLFLFLAISIWFVPMLYWVEQSQNPLFEQYRDNILFKQTGERYTNSWTHVKPFWYYVFAVIPFFWLPISIMLPWLVKRWNQAIKHNDRRIILLLGWVLLVLIFFSASPGKRGVYILPALPMLCLISAPYLKEILSFKWPKLIAWLLVAILSFLAVIFGVAGLIEIKATVKLVAKYNVEPWGYFLTLGIIGLLISLITFKTKKGWTWILVLPCVWVLYSTWGYQLLNPVKTPKNVLESIEKLIPEHSELAIIGMREQFIYFSPVSFTHFGYHTSSREAYKEAWRWQSEKENRYLLTHRKADHTCYDLTNAVWVGYVHRKDWLLLSTEDRLKSCDETEKQVFRNMFQPKFNLI